VFNLVFHLHFESLSTRRSRLQTLSWYCPTTTLQNLSANVLFSGIRPGSSILNLPHFVSPPYCESLFLSSDPNSGFFIIRYNYPLPVNGFPPAPAPRLCEGVILAQDTTKGLLGDLTYDPASPQPTPTTHAEPCTITAASNCPQIMGENCPGKSCGGQIPSDNPEAVPTVAGHQARLVECATVQRH
jgi:hypothetical protein